MRLLLLLFLTLCVVASEAAKVSSLEVEEVILREGDQHQRHRQERRFEQQAVQEQEVEIIYEERNGDTELIEDIVIVKAEDNNNFNNNNEATSQQPPLVNVVVTPDSIHRGLVPQLWPNYTGPELPDPETVSCDVARMKCAYRAGCGLALQNYALGCLDLVKGKTSVCNTHCRHSLIALMSTPEGQRLMKCNCSGDAFCEASKLNIHPCQKEVVYATREDTVVSCSAAQWICAADPMCSTALEYYNRFCQAMFRGKRCTDRCMNSISILRRQKAASKLETCYCDGTENFDCVNIKTNMEALCFREEDIIDNEIDTDDKPGKSGAWKAKMDKFLILVTIFAGFFFHWVGASFSALVDSVSTASEDVRPPPPEEIGLQ